MGYTDSENKEEDALFRKDLIEKLMKFGNHYEESLAFAINKTDVHKILSKIINNEDNQNESETDILSIWKKANQ